MTHRDLEELSVHVHNYGQHLPYEKFYNGKNARNIVLDEAMERHIHYYTSPTIEAYKTLLNSLYGENGVGAKMTKTSGIKAVHFSGPCTIVIWNDGTKTMVRQNLEKDPIFDPEKGLALAIAKHFLGTNENKSNYYDEFKKWLPSDDE